MPTFSYFEANTPASYKVAKCLHFAEFKLTELAILKWLNANS